MRMRKERESNFCVLSITEKNKGRVRQVSALEDKQSQNSLQSGLLFSIIQIKKSEKKKMIHETIWVNSADCVNQV